jgi:2'-hydroxyisoflavone reductase
MLHEVLKDRTGHFLFVSSISVYKDFKEVGIDETYGVGMLVDETTEQITGETYGPLKALCEKAAQGSFGSETTIIRPGLIIGPMDRSDRFTYWPVRVRKGGDIVAPVSGKEKTQMIDVRDLAAFIVSCMERSSSGVFNATSPPGHWTMGSILTESGTFCPVDHRVHWLPWEHLQKMEVQPWMEMTAWTPMEGDYLGFADVKCDRALAAGLTFRSLHDTIEATLAWWDSLPASRKEKMRAGLSAEKESRVLAAYLEQKQQP